MEECMIDCMRKVALWLTRTLTPIMTHEQLEPIMSTLGFVGLRPSSSDDNNAWKEYVYLAKSSAVAQNESPPRPRLPYPTVDGLHIYTYRAFIDAVNFYLNRHDFLDLFHLRGMPLRRNRDIRRKWRRMDEDDYIFVYRDGTLEPATYDFYHTDRHNHTSSGIDRYDSFVIRRHSAPPPFLYPMEME